MLPGLRRLGSGACIAAFAVNGPRGHRWQKGDALGSQLALASCAFLRLALPAAALLTFPPSPTPQAPPGAGIRPCKPNVNAIRSAAADVLYGEPPTPVCIVLPRYGVEGVPQVGRRYRRPQAAWLPQHRLLCLHLAWIS